MQAVLDVYLEGYNQRRPHQGRGMHGRTPAHAFKDGLPPAPAKENQDQTPNPKKAARPSAQAALSGDYPPVNTLRKSDFCL